MARAQDIRVDEKQELHKLFSMPREGIPLCHFLFWEE